jgi:mRNA interferase HigB
VRVISLSPLREFWERHPDAEMALRLWYKAASHAEWSSLRDVRRHYPHADGIKTRSDDTLTVFNIAGNKYRLIVRIRHEYRLMNIRAILTHAEYGREAWKE